MHVRLASGAVCRGVVTNASRTHVGGRLRTIVGVRFGRRSCHQLFRRHRSRFSSRPVSRISRLHCFHRAAEVPARAPRVCRQRAVGPPACAATAGAGRASCRDARIAAADAAVAAAIAVSTRGRHICAGLCCMPCVSILQYPRRILCVSHAETVVTRAENFSWR